MKSSMNSLSGKALGRLLKENDFPFRADSEECNGSLENRGALHMVPSRTIINSWRKIFLTIPSFMKLGSEVEEEISFFLISFVNQRAENVERENRRTM